jgi:hypothetical protein
MFWVNVLFVAEHQKQLDSPTVASECGWGPAAAALMSAGKPKCLGIFWGGFWHVL